MKTVPFHFEGMVSTAHDIERGLRALHDMQLIVSSMVDGAIPDGDDVPPATILTYGYAFVKEVTELMDELGWKPWKMRRPINRARVADELADILAFLGLLIIHIGKLTGLTPGDLAAAYMRKSDINVARFNGEVDGYGGGRP